MSRIDTEQIDRAMRLVALLIASGHEYYWPILDRLEAELTILTRRKNRLNKLLLHSNRPLPKL